MNKLQKYATAVTLAVALLFLYSFFGASSSEELASFLGQIGDDTPVVVDEGNAKAETRTPKITIIAIWVPRSEEVAPYVAPFFQSVEANPEIDLLFVQVDKKGFGCRTYSAAPNVKQLCLSTEEYYKLHVEFLCTKWHCTSVMRDAIMSKMLEESESDRVNSFFRVLRNGIFRRWIDPNTTIWGWCDVDEFWGNFGRAFPWDVAHDFDVLVPASQPDPTDTKLIFTRGHMAFFRNSPAVLERFLSFRKFANYTNYIELPKLQVDTEESEFSHYIFSEEKAFTFLTFEAMENTYDTAFISQNGIFYTPLKKDKITDDRRKSLSSLIHPSARTQKISTFSKEGIEREATVFTNGHGYDKALWFQSDFVTYVSTGWSRPEELKGKVYIMRREPHGPVVQRLEPRERYVHWKGNVFADECLYKHWQKEKHDAWFKETIAREFNSSTVFVEYGKAEAEIWNLDKNA